MRDYKKLKKRIDISLERGQCLSILGGVLVGGGLLFSLGVMVGKHSTHMY